MGRIIHFVHQSLDGFIAGPNGEFDWPAMGPELSAYTEELTAGDTVFLYGRKVWDLMSGFWPNARKYSQDPHDLAFAPVWLETPKVVVSRTLAGRDLDWNTTLVSENVAEELRALAASGKNLVLFGGADLAAHLGAHGAIDEYRVVVHPVLLGGGTPAFRPAENRTELETVETRTFDGRSILLRHRVVREA
ncbi:MULTISPECIES: dihydrofolate reductase family protein [Streptomyces]|uniref:Deaminase n=1 Tax=Streptomyces venezuelae TaxID=54571 RepID=A0A5P2AQ68_STRVZ|nr:dihydrofolate reductase family protein [Streptomyces venezuelae]QES20166.1 deaminase [Streptomyces venezuelae]